MIKAGKQYVEGTVAKKIEYDVYEHNEVLKTKKIRKHNSRAKAKAILYIFLLFAMSSVVIYRYSKITELNYNLVKKVAEYNQLKEQNAFLKAKLDKDKNLLRIKQLAEERLGMQQPEKYQITYISVPKSDFSVALNASGSSKEKNGMFALILDRVGRFARLLY